MKYYKWLLILLCNKYYYFLIQSIIQLKTVLCQFLTLHTKMLYWCHICQKKFQTINNCSQTIIECSFCHQTATEQINQQNHPEDFQSYQLQLSEQEINRREEQQTKRLIMETMMGLFNFGTNMIAQKMPDSNLKNLLTGMLSRISQLYTQNAERFIRGSQIRDSNPATEEQLSKLERTNIIQDCAICQHIDEQQKIQAGQYKEIKQSLQKGLKLSCGHSFHQVCLKPWLNKTNTCPSCRKKL